MGVGAVLLHLLIVSGVVGRTPRVPLARHRNVMTTQGMVRGYFASRPAHYAYLGLPYARPPKRARFKAPKAPAHWDGIFEATHRIKCLQPDGSGEEDCLVVNVFVPDGAKSLPVLVHVHSGGFQRGWGSHEAPVRLLRLGFIVVTFNYRLGALGFLCLQTPDIPGNAGLKDQVAALYWVNRNIAKFGGNPLDVTLYGTGSGAVSVELLLLSEPTINLVHRAIIESGAVLSPSSICYDPFALAMAEAIVLGFEGGERRDLEKFYTNLPVRHLMDSSRIFHPCVESKLLSNSLLTMDPMEILKDGYYQHIPLLISYTNAAELSLIAENIQSFNKTPQNVKHLLPSNLAFETEDVKDKIAVLVKDFYFEENELLTNVVQNYVDYINDVFIEYPITKSSMLHAASSSQPVYLMKYTYKGSLSYNAPSTLSVAVNRHEVIFNYMFSKEDLQGFDAVVANRLLTLWSNFIRLGDPTPITTSLMPVIWEPVTALSTDSDSGIAKVSYFQFDKTVSNETPEGQQLVFWDYIYSKFYKLHAYQSTF